MIFDFEDDEGRDIFWHSIAHVLVQLIQERLRQWWSSSLMLISTGEASGTPPISSPEPSLTTTRASRFSKAMANPLARFATSHTPKALCWRRTRRRRSRRWTTRRNGSHTA